MMNCKTIKQIAEEIGVSKQAVQKRMSREPLCTAIDKFVYSVSTTKYIDVHGENLIKQAFGKSDCRQVDGLSTPVDDNESSNVYTSSTPPVDSVDSVDSKLYGIINSLNDIILKQQATIDKQQETIKELTFIVKAHVQTLQADKLIEMQKQQTVTSKKSFWKRIFRKSE